METTFSLLEYGPQVSLVFTFRRSTSTPESCSTGVAKHRPVRWRLDLLIPHRKSPRFLSVPNPTPLPEPTSVPTSSPRPSLLNTTRRGDGGGGGPELVLPSTLIITSLDRRSSLVRWTWTSQLRFASLTLSETFSSRRKFIKKMFNKQWHSPVFRGCVLVTRCARAISVGGDPSANHSSQHPD